MFTFKSICIIISVVKRPLNLLCIMQTKTLKIESHEEIYARLAFGVSFVHLITLAIAQKSLSNFMVA